MGFTRPQFFLLFVCLLNGPPSAKRKQLVIGGGGVIQWLKTFDKIFLFISVKIEHINGDTLDLANQFSCLFVLPVDGILH